MTPSPRALSKAQNELHVIYYQVAALSRVIEHSMRQFGAGAYADLDPESYQEYVNALCTAESERSTLMAKCLRYYQNYARSRREGSFAQKRA